MGTAHSPAETEYSEAERVRLAALETLAQHTDCDLAYCHGNRVAKDKQLHIAQISLRFFGDVVAGLQDHAQSLYDRFQGLAAPEGALGFGYRQPVDQQKGVGRASHGVAQPRWSLRFPTNDEVNAFVPVRASVHEQWEVFQQTRLYKEFYGDAAYPVLDVARTVLMDTGDNTHLGQVELLRFCHGRFGMFTQEECARLQRTVPALKEALKTASQLEEAGLSASGPLATLLTDLSGQYFRASDAAQAWLAANSQIALRSAVRRFLQGGPARWVCGVAEVSAARVDDRVVLVLTGTNAVHLATAIPARLFKLMRLMALRIDRRDEQAALLNLKATTVKTYKEDIVRWLSDNNLTEEQLSTWFFDNFPEERDG